MPLLYHQKETTLLCRAFLSALFLWDAVRLVLLNPICIRFPTHAEPPGAISTWITMGANGTALLTTDLWMSKSSSHHISPLGRTSDFGISVCRAEPHRCYVRNHDFLVLNITVLEVPVIKTYCFIVWWED